MYGPDPNAIYPNEHIPSLCYIKNTITRKNITVGDVIFKLLGVNGVIVIGVVTHSDVFPCDSVFDIA